jgi:hypothetical protein
VAMYPNGTVPIWRISVFWLAGVLPRSHQFHLAGRHFGMDAEAYFTYALAWLQNWWCFALSEECTVLNLTVTNIIELYSAGHDLEGLTGTAPGPVSNLDKCLVVSFIPEYAERRLVDRWYLPGISDYHVTGNQLNRAGIDYFATWGALMVNAGCTPEQEAGWQLVNVRPLGTFEEAPLNPGWNAWPVECIRVSRYLANTPRVSV